MQDRRRFFRNVFGAGLGLSAAQLKSKPVSAPALVQTPDVPELPHTLDNGVKVFYLIAEPVKRQIAPNKTIDAWGYNGTSPGPTIQITQGDRVRIVFENRLPERTSMHWHGFEIPNAMDGGPNISQKPVNPGERFVYEFTLHQEGTYFYHSHMAMQEMMGMLGAFIMHPKTPYEPRVDKDFVLMLQEFAVLPSNTVPNSMDMEFNWLLFNGKAGPTITPLIVRLGERVRIRFINLGMDHHPIHLHGHTFYVTGTEGGRIPNTAWIPGNTVLVGVAQARDIEFVANNPGDWMLHCHLPHHMMNQMSSNAGPMTRMGAGSDRTVVNGPLSSQHANMPGMNMPLGISPDANQVPGFPQDAFMEGPMMNMDKMVSSPATYGLPPGWTEDMQGMMTLVRVLHPDKYDDIMNRIRRGEMPSMPGMPGMQHPM
ncbi:MAG TPA: copper oxidase [Bryobacteraceae bacterium]|jgi:FtsP/CotA-like multicopper oxidase with cupredoxin domain|nr:copper oxidase [Bryobacteraceae bacterium]